MGNYRRLMGEFLKSPVPFERSETVPIRLIAMDMDGTLLNQQPDEIPEENVKALRLAKERGIHLALCSGRLPDDAGFFALDAGLDMTVLALNGGCRTDHPLGEVRDSCLLQPAICHQLLKLLDETDLLYGVFRENTLAVNRLEREHAKAGLLWGTYIQRQGSRGSITYGRDAALALAATGCNKIVAIDEEDQGTLAVLHQRIRAEIQGISISSSWRNNMEINPAGVDKGHAVTRLAQELDIPLTDVMTIGDNENDVTMLKCAYWSVAMGNATENARAAARFVTLNNTENGVAAAIRTLALGEDCEGVRKK